MGARRGAFTLEEGARIVDPERITKRIEHLRRYRSKLAASEAIGG
jgi:hypothetical protein